MEEQSNLPTRGRSPLKWLYMRILDEDHDKALNRITLFLTLSEARELSDKLHGLLKGSENHHEHIPSDDFKKELTVTVYENHPLDSFDERSQRLISDDI